MITAPPETVTVNAQIPTQPDLQPDDSTAQAGTMVQPDQAPMQDPSDAVTQPDSMEGQSHPDDTPVETSQAPESAPPKGIQAPQQAQADAAPTAPVLPQAPPKPPVPPGVSPNDPNASHPQVQAAGVQNTVARALAGGDRYTVTIDPNTGQATRTRIPMSRGDIAMSIALSAISGGLAGLAAKGPAHIGQAGLLGLQQGQQIKADNQEQQQQAEKTATSDFNHQIQATEANMKMRELAISTGKLDLDSHDNLVGIAKDQIADIRANHPEMLGDGHVSEAEAQNVKDWDMTKWYRLADGVVPRTGPDGKPVYINQKGQAVPEGTPNSYQAYDNTYQMVHRDAKLNLGSLTDGDKSLLGKAVAWNQADKSILTGDPNAQVSGGGLASIGHNVGTLEAAQQDLDKFVKTVNGPKKGAYQFNSSGNVNVPNDDGQADQIDQAAAKYGVDKAILRSIAMQESGGHQTDPTTGNIVASGTGPTGIMQMSKGTSKQYGGDPSDQAQNIDMAAHYLSDLISQNKGDLAAALTQYGGGAGAVKGYASQVLSRAGITDPQGTAGGEDQYQPVDLKALVNDPNMGKSYARAMIAFQPFINGSKDHDYEAAIKAMEAKGPVQAAQADLVTQIYGQGHGSLFSDFDNASKLNMDQKTQEIRQNAELAKGASERAQKNAENQDSYMADAKAIAGDPNDPGSGDMVLLDKLISQRTADRPKVFAMIKKINPNWNMQEAEAKNNVWKSFTEGNGKGQQQVTSFNTLMQHIGQGIDVNDQFRRTNSPYLNQSYNWIAKHAINDPQVAEFQTAQAPIKSEFLTLLQNNHALTESDKAEGEALVNAADTPARFETVMKTIGATAAVRIKAVNSQWTRMFGNGHNVPGLIDPDSVGAISKLTDKDGKNKVADILKDMDTGGTVVGSSNGRGVPGKKLSEALGVDYAGPTAPGGHDDIRTPQQPQFQTGLKPIGMNPTTHQYIAKDAQGNYVDAVTGKPLGSQ